MDIVLEFYLITGKKTREPLQKLFPDSVPQNDKRKNLQDIDAGQIQVLEPLHSGKT